MSENLDMEYSGPTDFVHLHCHTVYSTLDGVVSPEQLFRSCSDRGWPAIAISEHGSLASVPDNYFAAKPYGIKFIPACEIYYNDYEPIRREMADRGEKISTLKDTDLDLHSRIMRNRHLTVLAKNMTGFHNLVKMTSEAYEFGFYRKPRIWFDKLLEYSEGLIILSGCLNGPVSHELNIDNFKSSNRPGGLDYVNKFREAFKDDYFIEVQMPCIIDEDKDDRKVFWRLHKIADKLGIPVVLTNDCHYLHRKDFEVQKLMMAVSQGVTVDSPDLFHVNSDEQYLKTRAELWETFKTKGYDKYTSDIQFENSCDNTLLVASKCDKFEPNLDPKIPTNDSDPEELKKLVLTELIRRGLHKCDKRYNIDNKMVTYKEQVAIELKRFIDKGFASYFLITRDLIHYSLDNGWPIGPRGSVGGSLVCYLLGITELDPLLWGLSFDRFLSAARGGYLLDLKAK